ncbi:MAG: GTP-binding protein, partial [Pseudomonadota bacterium]
MSAVSQTESTPAADRDTLRVLFCGSVDDGKSTLIGRVLYETGCVFEDQLDVLERDSKSFGTTGGLDFSLLVDGLEAEREQKITIDVAYRYFSTDERHFIIVDSPGHHQYTRNMATGASRADVAVMLIDARKGVLEQTRRHAFIASLFGVSEIILAVNTMDLVDYDAATFFEIEADFARLGKELGIERFQAVPLSALDGANVVAPAPEKTPWYQGPALMDLLKTIEVQDRPVEAAFRFLVQWVNRPHLDFRGVSGMVVSGAVAVGDEVMVQPGDTRAKIARIVTQSGDLERAEAGDCPTLVFDREIDASRGDVIAHVETAPALADQFEAHILWMDEEPMFPGRPYVLKTGARSTKATVTDLKYRINVNTFEQQASKTLELNDIAVCTLSFDLAVPFDPYAEIKETGSFILIDRFTNRTVGVGLIKFALRRATNVHWQSLDVDKTTRAKQKDQK